MSDVDLPKIGAPATSALAAIGITRLVEVVDRSQAELLALHGSVPEPCAFSTKRLRLAVSRCVPELQLMEVRAMSDDAERA